MRRRRFLGAGVAGTLAVAGCLGDESRPTVASTTTMTGERTPIPDWAVGYGYSYGRESGNRVIEGAGRLPDVEPTEIDLDYTPRWIATTRDHLAGDSRTGLWCVVSETGTVELFRIPDEGQYERVPVEPESIPEGMPPLLAVGEDRARVVVPPWGASSLTHPLILDGRTLYVDSDGTVVVRSGGFDELGRQLDTFAVDALPDARLITDNANVYVLSGATDRYDHGALGDAVEAGSVTVIDPFEPEIRTTIEVPGNAVVEGVAPMLGSLADGAEPHLVVTETDAERGARIVAYSRNGDRVASGPAIGQGYRWRHQLCVESFAPDGVPEVAVVKTPHIGGTVEFYRRSGDELRIAATVDGYSSHAYQSRNLDGALAGDFDDDGRTELLVPTDERTHLAGIARTDGGATEAWRVPVGGTVTTNLAAAPRGERTAVGVGLRGSLRVL